MPPEALTARTMEVPEDPAPGSAYFYLVQAFNDDCGPSFLGYDSEDRKRDNLDPGACVGPTVVDATASAETPVDGRVTGSFADTATSNDLAESIEEVLSGGGPSTRVSFLEHRWTFQVPAGDRIQLHVEGWTTSESQVREAFEFELSTDGGANWTPLASIALPDTDDDVDRDVPLPGGISGTIEIRVLDADRTPGQSTIDTIHLDHLFVRSVTNP